MDAPNKAVRAKHPAMRLTRTVIRLLPFVAKGQRIVRDKELRGFAVRIGHSKKTFIVEAKVRGRSVRYTIGSHELYSCDQARAEAKQVLLNMARGTNPLATKAELRSRGVTLGAAFHDFRNARSSLKAS